MTTPPVDPTGSSPLRGAEGVQPGGRASGAKKNENPAFRILLEKLSTQARELAEKSDSLDDPHHLAEAVDMARSSLDDAMSLGDQLLETFRGALHQNQGEPTGSEEEVEGA